MKNNKILIIVLAIVLVVSVGVGSYFIFDSIYTKEPETNNDLNNQTGNNNANNETNNNNGIKKTSLEILNDLVQRGYLKESNLTSKEYYEDYAYINKKGQFVIKYFSDDKGEIEFIADEINGKVSKVDLLYTDILRGFLVITEDGKLYSQNYMNRSKEFEDVPYIRYFEEIILPSKIKKIYKSGGYPAQYYVLLENNNVYELTADTANTDLAVSGILNSDSFFEFIPVSSFACGNICYPKLKFTYNGKVYFNNENVIYEIKDENNNSFSTKYAISSPNIDTDGMGSDYVDAYIIDTNNNIYVISKITKKDGGEHKINTDIKKYSTKKVKTVLRDAEKRENIIVYQDDSKETINGYSIEVIK